MHTFRTRSVVVGLVGLLALLALSGSSEAQMTAATAEVVRVVGRVDVILKGQAAWAPVSLGARLREGDQIRALAGGSADLNMPDGSTILLAENTRFAVTRLDYDTASRDRNFSVHLVAGKVRAQVQQAGVTLARTRQSNFNISTPTGVAAVRGTILISAFNPATQETLTFVFPSPGQSASAARATFVARGGQSVTVTGGNFVRQVGNQPPGAVTPIGNLPAAVQAALTTAQNSSTANSNELIVINVTLPSEQDTLNILSSGGVGAGAGAENPNAFGTNTGGVGVGACPGCGQDVSNNPDPNAKGPICGTPPCPPAPAGSRAR
jgi:hypothetical protein